MKKEWTELVQGTAEGSAGVEIYPQLQLPSVKGKRQEFFWGFGAGYRYGMTSNTDEVSVHHIIGNPYVGYTINFYTGNWFMLGVGFYYEMELWQLRKKDYEEVKEYHQSYTGITVEAEYRYRFNRMMALAAGATVYMYFVEHTSAVVRPYMGVVITVVGGNYEK